MSCAGTAATLRVDGPRAGLHGEDLPGERFWHDGSHAGSRSARTCVGEPTRPGQGVQTEILDHWEALKENRVMRGRLLTAWKAAIPASGRVCCYAERPQAMGGCGHLAGVEQARGEKIDTERKPVEEAVACLSTSVQSVDRPQASSAHTATGQFAAYGQRSARLTGTGKVFLLPHTSSLAERPQATCGVSHRA